MRELDGILARTGYDVTHFQTSWGAAVFGEVQLVSHDDCSVIKLRSNVSITGTGNRDMLKTVFAFNTGKNLIHWKNQAIDKQCLAGFNLAESMAHYRLETGTALVAVLFKRSTVKTLIHQLDWDDVLMTMEGSNHVRCNQEQLDWFQTIVLTRLANGLLISPGDGGNPMLAALQLLKGCEQRNPVLSPGQRHENIMQEIVATARQVSARRSGWVVPTVDEFNQMCQWSKSSVNGVCKELYGMPAKRLLMGIQMEKAIELLEDPVMANSVGCGSTVRDVAEFLDVGIKSLSENMKLYRGMTPAKVRSEGQARQQLINAN